MHADERLLPDSKTHLQGLIGKEKYPIAYKFQIQNLQKDKKTILMSDGHRLFTNYKDIYFSGRIHEQISPSLKEIGGEIRESNVNLLHLGYSYTGEKEKQKNDRNRYLLKKMVKEEPENAYAHYTLGQFFALNGKHNQAIKHYKKAYQLHQLPADMTVSLLNVMAEELFKVKDLHTCQKYVEKSIDKVKTQVGGYYLLYKLAEHRKEYSRAIQHLNKILINSAIINKSGKQISTDVIIEKDRVLFTIANLYYKQKNRELAYKNFVQAYSYNNKSNYLKKAFQLAIELGDSKKFESLFELQTSFDQKDIHFLHNIGINLIKKGFHKFALKSYKSILNIEPNNRLALKRAAGLYAKLSNRKKAAQLVHKLQNLSKSAQ
ncbi:MAG: hypothetical protein K9M80_02650 [Candidatus Marinimicrobia bacterium]|nr:hypothetical protein [Candidatus Neomarinimicrobiota bacterium]